MTEKRRHLRYFIWLILFTVACTLLYYNYMNYFSATPSYWQMVSRELFNSSEVLRKPTVHKSTNKTALQLRMEVDEEVQIALEKASAKMNILVYQLPFHPDPYMIKPDRSKCGECDLLWDKKYLNHPDTKAVLFYFDQFRKDRGIPKERNLDQYWGFWTREGPPASKLMRGLTFEGFDNFFNFTMSFRRDSDIWDPYDTAITVLTKIKSQENGRKQEDIIDELVKSKSEEHIAAWVVSNCGALPGSKRRLKLAENLVQAGLKLDRRGGCFKWAKRIEGKITDFTAKYKFYMAFENSWHCRDYITEKLTVNSLMSGAVPVVFGATKEDVAQNMPPNSFIYADDFESPAALANYLKYLDGNDTAYKKYLHWRTLDYKDMPYYMREPNFCQLCRVLHGINVDNLFNTRYEEKYKDKPLFGNYRNTVPSIRDWYYGSENEDCWKK